MSSPRSSLGSIKNLRVGAVKISTKSLVDCEPLTPERSLPMVMRPRGEAVALLGWAADNVQYVEAILLEHGALLLRGFDVRSLEDFERFSATISSDLVDYYERSTPRTKISGKVYTSTEYPESQHVPIHNECAYAFQWPMKVIFFCLQPAKEGGCTPIMDSREVYRRLDPAIRDPFAERKLLYVRNYHEGFDIPWQTAFQTTDRSVVESYCRKVGLRYEWTDGGRLRTLQLRDAIARHPRTGDLVWFNQAHAFHVSNLEASVRDAMLEMLSVDDLPRNVLYGDGAPIPDEAFAEIRQVFDELTVTFPWQAYDILLLDNMRVAHGREPFVSPRKVVVAMADAMDRDRLAGTG